MRSGFSLLLCLTALIGCSRAAEQSVITNKEKPSAELVDKIEAMLSSDPCLKDIKEMRREYRFSIRAGKHIPGFIDISVRQGGINGLPTGRFILEPTTYVTLDDGSSFAADATYSIGDDKLDVWLCGADASTSVRHKPVI
jgi:hypothetical protein